jgi:hypothetical protein
MVHGWYLYETQPLRINAIDRQVITWKKHGEINNNNNMFKIYFTFENFFDINIKKNKKIFVSRNIKPFKPPLNLW